MLALRDLAGGRIAATGGTDAWAEKIAGWLATATNP
jgi:hypothetical protein